jgi:NitT/TauT family transport system substrate-binding protein
MKKLLTGFALLAVVGCGGPSAGVEGLIRVGYFPNITHSQAIIGLARGDFENVLGAETRIESTVFNAGPSVIEALYAGRIDMAYIGPNPAITGFVRSRGEALRIVAGATSGGASLVVRPEAGIHSLAELDGMRIATPQLGNTQDVALRKCIADLGLSTIEEGGTVQIIPTANPQILDLFRQGQIDGAWVPEPWASRLVVEGGGVVLLDERTMWPDGDFVTAHIIVSAPFLRERPEIVYRWLAAHVEITLWENENPEEASALLNAEIEKLTGKALSGQVLDMALSAMRITWDPIAPSLVESARAAWQTGFLDNEPDLRGIYDLALLNRVLLEKGLEPVEATVEP